jgi:hypothetical protein
LAGASSGYQARPPSELDLYSLLLRKLPRMLLLVS